MSLRSLQQLLCEPLMIDHRALNRLFDGMRLELQTRSQRRASSDDGDDPPLERPPLSYVYDAGGMRLTEVDTSGQAPGSLIAVVPLAGLITRHGFMDFWSWSVAPGSLEIGRHLQRLDADEAVGAIVMSVDSPGGSAYGTPELAKVLFDIRSEGRTKTVAVVDPMMASAATYIATAAEKVYAIPTADVGSIGVISSYSDYSEYLQKLGVTVDFFRMPEKKARFTGAEKLDDDMRQTAMDRIEELYELFVTDMARNRSVSEKHVKSKFGGGEMMGTDAAIDANLIDGMVSSIDEVIAELAVEAQEKKRRHARRGAAARLEAIQKQSEELAKLEAGL